MEITPSRTGEPTALIAGVALHSRYDPLREAERFLQSSLPPDPPSVVLLLGAGLGYLTRCIRRRFPAARVIAFYYDREIYERGAGRESGGGRESGAGGESGGRPDPARPDLGWHPGLPEAADAWLRRRLGELDLEGLRLVEWPPSSRIYPSTARAVRRAVEQVLRELRGSLVTTRAAGRRWIRNSFLNFCHTPALLQEEELRDGRPIVLAASGPSLEKSRGWLAGLRERYQLWALPSAALFLKGEGLTPDLVVLTDPSWYALYHLHPVADRPLRLAMPLSAAAGCWRLRAGVLWLCQQNFFERELLEAAGVRAPAVPPHGTVTATALELALRLSRRPIVLAGLDLVTSGIRTHARPNCFERFLEPASGRLAPLHSLLFERALEQAPRRLRRGADGGAAEGSGVEDDGVEGGAVDSGAGGEIHRSGLSLETYAGWFHGFEGGEQVLRIHPSPVPLPGFREIGEGELRRLLEPEPAAEGAPPDAGAGAPASAGGAPPAVRGTAGAGRAGARREAPPPQARREIAGRILRKWEERLRLGRERLERRKSLRPLGEDSFLLNFCYFFQAGALTEVRKIHRLQGEQAAVRPATRLLEEGAAFLRQLARDTARAAEER